MKRDERGPWYLLTGLVIGLVIGIIFSWAVAPVRYINTDPASLRDDFKEQYRSLIAAAFAANGDLARAQARLSLLQDPDIADTLAAQAQRALAAGHPQEEVRALGQLAAIARDPQIASQGERTPLSPSPSLTSEPTFTATGLPSPIPSPSSTLQPIPSPGITSTPTITAGEGITQTLTPHPTRTPTPTRTPFPSPTATSTPGGPFILDKRNLLCDPDIFGPLLIVQTLDADGKGVPGVEIIVSWNGSEEHFFTGLKPELGLGYADFLMTPDLNYTLRLADGSQLITDLTPAECQTETGKTIWGSWELDFVQP